MTVSLTNTSLRCQVFVLAHEVFCAACGRCACRTGARRVASSLTIASGMTVGALSDAVLAVPEVSRAIRSGALLVKRGVA
jgi:hypothetical protein